VKAAAAGAAVLLVATLLGCPARGSAAGGASVTVDQPGVLGAFMPSTITVSASGLSTGLSYAVGFDEADLTAADIKTDPSGAMTVSDVLVPGAACGDHAVSIVYYTAIVHIAQVPAAPTPAALQRNIVASTNYRVLCPSADVDRRSYPARTCPVTSGCTRTTTSTISATTCPRRSTSTRRRWGHSATRRR
jgi:hypothetical protein